MPVTFSDENSIVGHTGDVEMSKMPLGSDASVTSTASSKLRGSALRDMMSFSGRSFNMSLAHAEESTYEGTIGEIYRRTDKIVADVAYGKALWLIMGIVTVLDAIT
tara:strand:- start:365 stop:682 length:318 start_codon:yes stop_codon:yes gene_type:complete